MQDKHLQSEVPHFTGSCIPTWVDTNTYSGFRAGLFRLVKKHWLFGYLKTGNEFYGWISNDTDDIIVRPTGPAA